jgi:hypothetical protein
MYQRRVSANYERQMPRVQEQMTKDLDEKEKMIEKMKVENDKFKVLPFVCPMQYGHSMTSVLQAHMVRQSQQYEKLCRQMEDVKEEMRTRVSCGAGLHEGWGYMKGRAT